MTSKKNPKQGKKRGRKPTGKGRYGVLSCRVSTEEKAAFELLALTRHKCSPAALLGQLARAAMDSKALEHAGTPEPVKGLEAVTFTEDDLVDSDYEPPAPPDTRDTIDSLEDLE